MYKAQYKTRSPYESWTTSGSYSGESEAINNAQRKKSAGALIVRVVKADGSVIFSN